LKIKSEAQGDLLAQLDSENREIDGIKFKRQLRSGESQHLRFKAPTINTSLLFITVTLSQALSTETVISKPIVYLQLTRK